MIRRCAEVRQLLDTINTIVNYRELLSFIMIIIVFEVRWGSRLFSNYRFGVYTDNIVTIGAL